MSVAKQLEDDGFIEYGERHGSIFALGHARSTDIPNARYFRFRGPIHSRYRIHIVVYNHNLPGSVGFAANFDGGLIGLNPSWVRTEHKHTIEEDYGFIRLENYSIYDFRVAVFVKNIEGLGQRRADKQARKRQARARSEQQEMEEISKEKQRRHSAIPATKREAKARKRFTPYWHSY